MEIAATVFRNIVYAAVNQGVDLAMLCQKIGISQADLDNPEKRFGIEAVEAVWLYGVTLSNNPLLGLHIGKRADFSAFGIVGYMMQSSPDIATALERGCYYNNLSSSLIRVSFEQKKGMGIFRAMPIPIVKKSYPLTAKHGVEETFAFIINAVQKLSGKTFFPKLVRFTFQPEANHVQEYEQLFPTSLVFNAAENALVYRKKDLQFPVVGYNRHLFDLLNSEAQQLLDNLSNKVSFDQKVRQTIIQLFNHQFPTIELVANKMNTSVRSLQRKLKHEGATFQSLLDDIRKEFAIRYLKNKQLSISEVAYLLGFSEPSVFSRSFKRWMGISPKEYIRNQII